MNFQPLAFLDPFDLIASLPRRMGLFKIGSDDQDNQPKMLFIRTQRADEYRNVGDLGKWPELRAILNQIERGGEAQGGIALGYVWLELLPAGVLMPWDEEPAPTDVNRLIIALRTSPGVMHYAGTEAMHLVPGFVTWVNQRVPHCTINLGETNSIHLIVDTRRKEAS